MPYLHPSMPDTELLRACSTMEAQHVQLLVRRLEDRLMQARAARETLQGALAELQRPGPRPATDLRAMDHISRVVDALDWTRAPGY